MYSHKDLPPLYATITTAHPYGLVHRQYEYPKCGGYKTIAYLK